MNAIKLITAVTIFAGSALSGLPANAGPAAPVTGSTMHASTAYWILACPASTITSAIVKNWKRHKELNSQEAWTCGLLYWWNEGAGVYGR